MGQGWESCLGRDAVYLQAAHKSHGLLTPAAKLAPNVQDFCAFRLLPQRQKCSLESYFWFCCCCLGATFSSDQGFYSWLCTQEVTPRRLVNHFGCWELNPGWTLARQIANTIAPSPWISFWWEQTGLSQKQSGVRQTYRKADVYMCVHVHE